MDEYQTNLLMTEQKNIGSDMRLIDLEIVTQRQNNQKRNYFQRSDSEMVLSRFSSKYDTSRKKRHKANTISSQRTRNTDVGCYYVRGLIF
jgi:RIO-like serine/threonine protein kinase